MAVDLCPLAGQQALCPQQTEGDQADLRRELRDLLCRMQIEAIEEQQKVLVLQAEQDPTALERYRGLEQKRTLLRASLRDGLASAS